MSTSISTISILSPDIAGLNACQPIRVVEHITCHWYLLLIPFSAAMNIRPTSFRFILADEALKRINAEAALAGFRFVIV